MTLASFHQLSIWEKIFLALIALACVVCIVVACILWWKAVVRIDTRQSAAWGLVVDATDSMKLGLREEQAQGNMRCVATEAGRLVGGMKAGDYCACYLISPSCTGADAIFAGTLPDDEEGCRLKRQEWQQKLKSRIDTSVTCKPGDWSDRGSDYIGAVSAAADALTGRRMRKRLVIIGDMINQSQSVDMSSFIKSNDSEDPKMTINADLSGVDVTMIGMIGGYVDRQQIPKVRWDNLSIYWERAFTGMKAKSVTRRILHERVCSDLLELR